MKNITAKGYSLLELLIVLAIITIVSSLAYPTYTASAKKLQRLEAKSALLTLQNNYERYFITYNTYEKAKIGAGEKSILKNPITKDGSYSLEITEQSTDYYLLTATPHSKPAKKDKECASFTLSSLGEKGITGTGSTYRCWNH